MTERDPGHLVLAPQGLSSQSGTSGSAADAVRGLVALLGKGALKGNKESLIRLTHLYMRNSRFYDPISSKIAKVKTQRGLPEPTGSDVDALPTSHTHSLGEIAQGIHLQSGISSGQIEPDQLHPLDYRRGADRAQLAQRSAPAQRQAQLARLYLRSTSKTLSKL